MTLPSSPKLTEAEKDALILAQAAMIAQMAARIAELEAKLNEPPKTPDNSSTPPSKGQKANRPEKAKRLGPRKGSLGRKGGGRPLAAKPDRTVVAQATTCVHCQAALGEADQTLHGRYDKIDLPPVRPVVTRVERYAGHCPCCGGTTLAPVPEGMEDGSPFSLNIMTLALYLRFAHAISYRRLHQLFAHLFGLAISEGALDAMLRRAKPAIEAGDTVFAPRMKALLLRAVVLARRRHGLAQSTRREYRRRLDRDLDAIMGRAPENHHGKRLRKRYAKHRSHLFTFLEHPEVPPDNNGSERELRPTATYRKGTGGFRSDWGADLFAATRSVIGTAARRGLDAFQAIRATLCGEPAFAPG